MDTHIHVNLAPESFFNLTTCSIYLIAGFTYSSNWCIIIGTLIYEFGIYPVIRTRVPTILKRIGITSFLIISTSTVVLILELVQHFYMYINTGLLNWSTNIFYWMSNGLLTWTLLCAALELVVSQAPYNMRGLFSSFMILIIISSSYLGQTTGEHLPEICSSCGLIRFGIKVVISLFGFVLYCLLARWYKRRERDDVFSPHRVVEEVYDRYLTTRAAHT